MHTDQRVGTDILMMINEPLHGPHLHDFTLQAFASMHGMEAK